MDSFAEREEGFERAFSRQEEMRFKARARRNRKLGAWAGEKLGLSGPALEAYVAALVARGLDPVDDQTLVADLAKALQPHDISEHRVRRRLEAFEAEAVADLQAGR
jgi:hypothetical protein